MNFNPYTPPSSSEDSPHSFMATSPPGGSSYYVLNTGTPMNIDNFNIENQYNFENQYVTLDEKKPFLVIKEQPIGKFRFRYKSEMAGTHGSLNGISSDKTRRQTFPSVELQNYSGSAIVRCSLYQYHSSSKERQPHPHRLIKKMGNEEVDDPHATTVGGTEEYTAIFHSMGIIHTAKKNLIDELCRKKEFLKEEEIARKEGKRKLRRDEKASIRHEAEEESKSINMNIVCLRFDAFTERPKDGVLIPICEPVYSHEINNLKSALTGELKIVRMSCNCSPAKGNTEIFMLVEKVTKKNIRIRFYEIDEDGYEIWSADGKFTELDVHHQYAIVFRTPPYKDQQITEQRTVYVELMRKTDNSKSEPREFKYYPSPSYQPGMKRSRMSHSFNSNESFYSSGEKIAPIPITLGDSNEIPSINSDEFNALYQLVERNMMNPDQFPSIRSEDFAADSSQGKYSDSLVGGFEEMRLSEEEKAVVKRVEDEFKSFLATKPSSNLIASMIVSLFEDHVTTHEENALHLLVKSGNINKLNCWLEVIKRNSEFQILNAPNRDGHTIGHLAAIHNNPQILNIICRYSPDFSILDNEGNTPLHLAVIKNSPPPIVDLLIRSKELTKLPINAENNDSATALQISVSKSNLVYVKLLCEHGADINVIDKKCGYNVLHTAIDVQAIDILKYLIQKPKIDLMCMNYNDMTPYQMAKRLTSGDENDKKSITILNILEKAMLERGLNTEIYIKEEQESEDEMECDFVECKPEKFSTEELQEMYKNVKTFTSECLTQVSQLLDESGKWENLALLLDMQHIVYTSMFEKAKSKSQQLLQTAEKDCNLYDIRNFLEDLEEHNAVVAMDKMVFSLQDDF
ncbi:nuclear factor NF-kappa-B p110 subunit isoform X2 [Onthophagus taurus]|nr:nuclear factor NF-kappa-B p110 subunit isoform X2 [Onthophagus taurus]